MKTLLEKLRPEITEALEESRQDYDYSITGLYDQLDTMYLYSEINVGLVRDLILYGGLNDNAWDKFDWKYGDKIFIQDSLELAI